jgi:hypothetical protein
MQRSFEMNKKYFYIGVLTFVFPLFLIQVKASNQGDNGEHLTGVLPDEVFTETVLPRLDAEALKRLGTTSKGAEVAVQQELDRRLDEDTRQVVESLDRLVASENERIMEVLEDLGVLVDGYYSLPVEINGNLYSIANYQADSNYKDYSSQLKEVLKNVDKSSKAVEQGKTPLWQLEGALRGLQRVFTIGELTKTPIKAGSSLKK